MTFENEELYLLYKKIRENKATKLDKKQFEMLLLTMCARSETCLSKLESKYKLEKRV